MIYTYAVLLVLIGALLCIWSERVRTKATRIADQSKNAIWLLLSDTQRELMWIQRDIQNRLRGELTPAEKKNLHNFRLKLKREHSRIGNLAFEYVTMAVQSGMLEASHFCLVRRKNGLKSLRDLAQRQHCLQCYADRLSKLIGYS